MSLSFNMSVFMTAVYFLHFVVPVHFKKHDIYEGAYYIVLKYLSRVSGKLRVRAILEQNFLAKLKQIYI